MHGLEDRLDGRALAVARLEPEQVAGGGLGERSFGTEIGDPERLLHGEAGAHDLAEDGADRVRGGGEALAAALHEPIEHLALALRIVKHRDFGGAFHGRDLTGDVGALLEELQDRVVEGVDAGASGTRGAGKAAGRSAPGDGRRRAEWDFTPRIVA